MGGRPVRLTSKDARGAHVLAGRNGFAEVSGNVRSVLSDAAAAPADVNAARAELQAAEAELAKPSPIDPLWRNVDARRRWALARLEIAK